ncbi:VOC family protein [Catellatospora citrea]
MTVISVMLAVPDAAGASAWYQQALGVTELWNLGSSSVLWKELLPT